MRTVSSSHRHRRARRSGQGFVEFSLVLPVFLAAVWGLVNGGLLLYAVNAVQHSAMIGANSIAASGNAPDSDILGVERMVSGGLGTTLLISVSEIDVEELVNSPTGGFTVGADGAPTIHAGCSGAGGAFAGTGDCVDRYSFIRSGGAISINALDGTCPTSTDVSQCPPWPPEARSVSNSGVGQSAQGAGASYLALVIHYRFTFAGAPTGGVNLTSSTAFRLEPQT